MKYEMLELNAFRDKVKNCISKYLNISDKIKLSIGLYYQGKTYICDLNEDENKLMYDIGSITKTITSHMILKNVFDNKIDLNKRVDEYLKLKQGNYPSVYELITHTYGYNYLSPIEITIPRLLFHRYAKYNVYTDVSKEDIIKSLEKRRKKTKKKKYYSYSDFSHAILALILEEVEKKSFSDLLIDYCKQELSMNNTCLQMETRYPMSVLNDKYINSWLWNLNNPYLASGGIISNIFDMMKYIKKEIESEEEYILKGHELCNDSFSKKSKIGTTLSWHTYKDSNQLWHVGGVGTFRSSLIFNKKTKIGLVVLGNSKGIRSANVHYLAKMIYSELKFKRVKL